MQAPCARPRILIIAQVLCARMSRDHKPWELRMKALALGIVDAQLQLAQRHSMGILQCHVGILIELRKCCHCCTQVLEREL